MSSLTADSMGSKVARAFVASGKLSIAHHMDNLAIANSVGYLSKEKGGSQS